MSNESLWAPYAQGFEVLWTPYADKVVSLWTPYVDKVMSLWAPYAQRFGGFWGPYADEAGRLWSLYGPGIGKALRAAVPSTFVLVLLLLPLLPIIGCAIYYAFLHPLAKYPGPFWGKFTGARAAYHAWIGDVHIDMWMCHQKYEAYKDIYGHNKNVQKSLPYLAMVHNTPSIFTLRDKREHAWKKRILSQKLSDSAVRSFDPKVVEILDRFCQAVVPKPGSNAKGSPASDGGNPWSEPFNMSHWSDNLFFDLVTTIVFGENFDLIRKPWYRHIPEALARSNERMSVIVQFPLVVYRRMDKILFRDSVFGRKEFLRFVHNMVTERMTQGSKDDVFSALLDAADPATGNKLSEDEIVAESILMLVAGSDTSSTLLASMFFYLTRNPDKKDKLFKEIRTQFASRDEIHLGSKLSSCRYLHACISECLRLTPPVAAAPFREVSAGGVVVDGLFVPAGVNVGTGIFSLHHNEKCFHDPFRFIPERWLADANVSGPHEPDAFVPFSIGPRVCLGRGLAISEASLAMAHICWRLDFQVVESMRDVGGGNKNNVYGRHRPDEFQLYDHITCSRNGPMIQFRERSL